MSASIADLAGAFRRTLQAENKSPKTVRGYGESVRFFDQFLEAAGMPRAVAHVRREHVEAFIADLVGRLSASTAETRFRNLRVFFRWAIDHGELRESPMRNMRPPRVEEYLPPVVSAAHVQSLLAACSGSNGPRDRAMILLFLDSGLRRGELARLQVPDLDLEGCYARVMGKGRKERVVAFGPLTATALARYIGARLDGPLWLGERGPLGDDALRLILRRRCKDAGLAPVNPHRLRHTWASTWLTAGGNEGDLMTLAGWSSRAMVDRYGRVAAAERARLAHARISPLDSLLA